MNIYFKAIALSALVLSMTACGHMSKQERRVVAGTVAGAALGYAVTGEAAGAIGGAALGGVAGVATNQHDRNHRRVRY